MSQITEALKRLLLDRSTSFFKPIYLSLILEALPDQQRHHVREGSRSLGHTLQIRRADEHPDAFQVSSYAKAVHVFSWPGSFPETEFIYDFILFAEKNVTTPTGRANRWEGKWILKCISLNASDVCNKLRGLGSNGGHRWFLRLS